MLANIIRGIVRYRFPVLLLVLACTLLSLYAIVHAPLDAIPDISDPQIVVYVKWPRSPQLLESEVTAPLARALVGSPGIQSIRATSDMGYSFVYVILDKSANRDKAQQLVLDKINTIRPQLPPDANITLGPNASSMGWIYQYALVDRENVRDLRELRLLNEGQIKPALQTVPGVAEVASVGGLEEQYQIKIYPPLLATVGVSLRQIIATLQSAFQEAGGRSIEVTNREYQLRGVVNNDEIDKLEYLVIGRTRDQKPIYLRDVGYIQVGYDLRRSTADLNGAGEVVGGVAIMEQDQNVLAVTRAIEDKMRQIRETLPEGVEIVSTYDRSAWIWTTLKEFFGTLLTEFAVLILVTSLFLGNLRTAAGPIAILLLSTLFTALPLFAFGQTINLFSLAGLCIAIGEIADATIVHVENCAAELSMRRNLTREQRREIVIHSITHVAKPLTFALLIILASFLPVFFLEDREARLFDPLAYSKTFAMGFSTLLTLFLLPILTVWIFERDHPSRSVPFRRALSFAGIAALLGAGWWFRDTAREFAPELIELGIILIPVTILWMARKRSGASHNYQDSSLMRAYRAALAFTIRRRYVFTTAGLLALIPGAILLNGFQRDFLPETDEGSILYMPTTLPGLPTREAGWVLQQMDKKLKAVPEVASVFGKLGRADTSTDPAPVSMVETTILLKPRSEWRPGVTKGQIVAEMDGAMNIIGYVNSWVQPIRARVMMQSTGIQTPVGVKVKGPDIAVIEDLSQKIEALLGSFPGTKSVIAERISQGYYIDVQNDLERMAEHGVTIDEAMDTVRYAIGGDNILNIKKTNGATIPLSVQYSPEYIDTVQKVKGVPIATGDGRSVPIGDVADVSVRKLPEMIRNDNGQLAGYIYIDIGNVTASDYVEKAKAYLAEKLPMPVGYSMEWTGLYQYTEAARGRLRVIVPLTLIIIFVLLIVAFRSVGESLLIMLSVPFAMVGGVFLQWALGYSMTTAVIVGYISLFAIAVQTGIIMVIFIREALAERQPEESYIDAVIRGSTLRLRPKLMTVAAVIFSLAPIAFSTRPGMDIMKPIAAPSIGGMITSTLHVLFMTPCLFVIVEDIRRSERFQRLVKAAASTRRSQ
ncbi:MAG TPA: efflux RND transporter permease subunit [Terriglobia bacterium]|nr:efflux RND transporter permease subunit [Terriglobia bacterium]